MDGWTGSARRDCKRPPTGRVGYQVGGRDVDGQTTTDNRRGASASTSATQQVSLYPSLTTASNPGPDRRCAQDRTERRICKGQPWVCPKRAKGIPAIGVSATSVPSVDTAYSTHSANAQPPACPFDLDIHRVFCPRALSFRQLRTRNQMHGPEHGAGHGPEERGEEGNEQCPAAGEWLSAKEALNRLCVSAMGAAKERRGADCQDLE